MSTAEKKGKISIAEVDYVARLARLRIKPADKQTMAEQLSGDIKYDNANRYHIL